MALLTRRPPYRGSRRTRRGVRDTVGLDGRKIDITQRRSASACRHRLAELRADGAKLAVHDDHMAGPVLAATR